MFITFLLGIHVNSYFPVPQCRLRHAALVFNISKKGSCAKRHHTKRLLGKTSLNKTSPFVTSLLLTVRLEKDFAVVFGS
jgi:hypothetical protein